MRREPAPVRQWRTQEEIETLREYGRGQGWAVRAAKLRRYLQAMPLRQRWGRIDPEVVAAYIRMELKLGGGVTLETIGRRIKVARSGRRGYGEEE